MCGPMRPDPRLKDKLISDVHEILLTRLKSANTLNFQRKSYDSVGFSWFHCTRCKAKCSDPDLQLTLITDSLGVLHLFCEACVTEYNLYVDIPCPHN